MGVKGVGVGGGGDSENILTGCAARVFATIPYGDRGPKPYPWLRKMGQN